MPPISRRCLFQSLTAGALVSPLLLNRADAEVTPDFVKFHPEIEPLVALIERTPRERSAEMAVEQLRKGVSYRQFMAGLFLAGIRNVNPRPPGFAMHCVFVIHSAHLLSLEAPANSRLLPLFYALDDFKAAQERDAKQAAGDYIMGPISGTLPTPDRAAGEFAASLEGWDAERAERAIVSLARNRGPAEIFEMLWRYGARDYRNIGHKAIYTANAARTLHTIGWQHAEPVLRSLALSLVDFGKERTMNGYAFDNQCYGANAARVRDTFPKLNVNWVAGAADASAARGIVAAIRESTPEEACAGVAVGLAKGTTTAASVWDGVHLAAAELMLRARPRTLITAIHAVTSANALHHAYNAAADPQVRFLMLLQAVGWMGQFRTVAGAREDNLRAFQVTALEPAASAPSLERDLEEIFAAIPANPDAAAARVFRLTGDLASRQAFLQTALRLTIGKVTEVHQYKYLAALIEDVALVSPEWQPHLLAAIVYYTKGSSDPEPAPMKRAREALRTLPA